jgi:hypothetical protein
MWLHEIVPSDAGRRVESRFQALAGFDDAKHGAGLTEGAKPGFDDGRPAEVAGVSETMTVTSPRSSARLRAATQERGSPHTPNAARKALPGAFSTVSHVAGLVGEVHLSADGVHHSSGEVCITRTPQLSRSCRGARD